MRRSTALFAVSLSLASALAFAQPKPKPKAPAAPPPTAAAAVPGPHTSPTFAHDIGVRMKSGDRAQIRSALDDVRMSGKAGAAAVPAIVDALKRGLDVPLTQAAIETLGDVESEAASDVLGWYAQHRNVAVRRSAVQALVKTKGAPAVRAMRAALSDQDAAVRGLSATGLGALKAKEAVPDLFIALDHKVAEAASSIGQLCAGGECEKLADKLGQLQFDIVTSGLDQVLFRPAAEVSDDTKIKVIGRIRELGTGEANKFLIAVQKKWPESFSKRVKQSIDQAVLATSGSAGATPVPQ